MPLTPISTQAFQKIAVGISDRPEDVVVGKDGRVFASDHQCAVADRSSTGQFSSGWGRGRGPPNGLNMDRQGRVLIANSASMIAGPVPAALQYR